MYNHDDSHHDRKHNFVRNENRQKDQKMVVTQMHQCLIPISLGGIKIMSLLDTGSTISAINKKTFLKSNFANESLKQPDISHIVAA